MCIVSYKIISGKVQVYGRRRQQITANAYLFIKLVSLPRLQFLSDSNEFLEVKRGFFNFAATRFEFAFLVRELFRKRFVYNGGRRRQITAKGYWYNKFVFVDRTANFIPFQWFFRGQ